MRCLFISRSLTTTVAVVLAGLGAGGCDLYGTFDDPDEKLGPVDPVLFPAANLGTGGDRKRPGRGRFSELTAYVNDEAVGYFSYALPMLAASSDPLRVLQDGKPYAPVPTPPVYVFDGNGNSPFPEEDQYPCTPPPGYSYLPQRDDVDYSKQGPVFSQLPQATYSEDAAPVTRYVPVVAEAGMGSSGVPCQQLKSTRQIKDMLGEMPATTGRYLAWLIIDPAAPVYPRESPTGAVAMGPPHPGVGLQRWGWYGRYLLAFLDGGFIPTEEGTAPGAGIDGPSTIPVTRLKPQRLFVPRQIRMGMGMAAGRAGAGYDVLEFRRGQEGYSPLCQIWNYGDPALPVAPAELPRRADVIVSTPALNAEAATPPTYVYCLQVR
jgi:hypothetical protein